MPIVLQQIVETGQMPSSLLLIGALKEHALDLAKQIFGPMHHAKIDSGNHPDLHIFAPEGKSELHPIANIQQLINEMSLPPFEASCKIFIVEEAEKMLPSSSNALLKTLEEPHEDTFFILLSNYPDKLFPTISSRLYPIAFDKLKSSRADVSSYFALAEKEQWDKLLEELFEEEPEDFLCGALTWASQQKNPTFFRKVAELVELAEKALQHNLKPRTVFLNLLLQIPKIHF